MIGFNHTTTQRHRECLTEMMTAEQELLYSAKGRRFEKTDPHFVGAARDQTIEDATTGAPGEFCVTWSGTMMDCYRIPMTIKSLPLIF